MEVKAGECDINGIICLELGVKNIFPLTFKQAAMLIYICMNASVIICIDIHIY